jgi:hypothetical protein
VAQEDARAASPALARVRAEAAVPAEPNRIRETTARKAWQRALWRARAKRYPRMVLAAEAVPRPVLQAEAAGAAGAAQNQIKATAAGTAAAQAPRAVRLRRPVRAARYLRPNLAAETTGPAASRAAAERMASHRVRAKGVPVTQCRERDMTAPMARLRASRLVHVGWRVRAPRRPRNKLAVRAVQAVQAQQAPRLRTTETEGTRAMATPQSSLVVPAERALRPGRVAQYPGKAVAMGAVA